jgi:hypothetical protein
MTTKDLWTASAVLLATVCILLIGCDQGNNPEPEFNAAEYIISAADTEEQLNITPAFVYSSDESIAIVELTEGNIIVTSKKAGNANISVSNFSSKSNAASIMVAVSDTGKIQAQIVPFSGNLVTAIVTEAVTIMGTVGSPIAPADIRIMMDNNDFSGVAVNDAVSSWISNLPSGLVAAISYIQAGDHPHNVTIAVSGTPAVASTETVAITIPQERTAMGEAVNVTSWANAKFAINAAGQ